MGLDGGCGGIKPASSIVIQNRQTLEVPDVRGMLR